MSNQGQKTVSLVHYYSDVSDAYSLAESDMHWMSTAITHTKREIKKLHDLAKTGAVVTEYHFGELMQHLEMYEYLADNRHRLHAQQAEKYTQKYDAAKGGGE